MNDTESGTGLNQKSDRIQKAWIRLLCCVLAQNEQQFYQAYYRHATRKPKKNIWQAINRKERTKKC